MDLNNPRPKEGGFLLRCNMEITESLKRRFWEKVDRRGPDECWEWDACRQGLGYGRIGLNATEVDYAHRVSWVIHNGEIPSGKFIMHSCDNPPCCNPAHLRLGTHTDNMQDMHNKGRGYCYFREVDIRGEKHPNSKLTADDVREIRNKAARGRSLSSLGREYQMDPTQISNIVRRRQWRHVK